MGGENGRVSAQESITARIEKVSNLGDTAHAESVPQPQGLRH